MAISVDIEKKLHGFTLKVKLRVMVLQWGSLEHPEAEKYDSALYCRNPDTGLRKNCCK